MSAQVRTIWPTLIGDAGKPPKFAVLFPGEHPPSFGDARARTFPTRAAAKAHADALNGVRDDDWVAS